MNLKDIAIQKYRNNKQLSKSFIWRLVQILSKQGTSALMFFIATFFLPKEQMGIYNYISSALILLVIFADFGISTSTSRYVALYNTESKEKVNRVFFNSFIMIFSVSVAVILIALILRERLFPQYSEFILFALPMIFVSPMTALLDGIYRGLKKFKQLAIVSILNSFVGIAISFIFVTTYGLVGAILAQLVYFSTYSIVLLLIHRGYEFKVEKKIMIDISRYAISFGIATLGFYFFSKVNILILGAYDLFEEIAVYELLNKTFMIFLIPFSVFGQVLAPNIVEIFSLEKGLKVLNIFKKLFKYLLLINIFFIPLSMIVVGSVIPYIFPQYANGIMHSLLLPISLTYAIYIFVTVLNSGILTPTGHARIMAIQNVVSGIVNVGLNLWAIQKYGYLGVVWITFGIQLISTVILYLVYTDMLKKQTNSNADIMEI